MGLDLRVAPEAQALEESAEIGRTLFEGSQDLRGQWVEEMRVPGSFIEDDELVVPRFPVKPRTFGETPVCVGGRYGGGRDFCDSYLAAVGRADMLFDMVELF